jgi:Flp pilus assembly secretin CpaC
MTHFLESATAIGSRLTKIRQCLVAAALLIAVTLPAAAQQRMLEVAVNTAELLQLQTAPGSVLVANPAIADVVVEGGRQVFVLGKAPGETQLFVLDENGGTMLRATVSVVPQTARHLNIIRGTEESQVHCAPRCAATPGQQRKASSAPAAAPAATPAPSTK